MPNNAISVSSRDRSEDDFLGSFVGLDNLPYQSTPFEINSETIMKEGYVLYVDHAKHPAPLSMCYHATGARRLSSAADRYPPATLTEVDSAYCPQCLSYHDAASAARMGK